MVDFFIQTGENRQTQNLEGPQNEKKCRESVLKVTMIVYYLNLLISMGAAITLLILFPELRKGITITFIIIIVYGFMLVWLAVINIVFVIIKQEKCAVWCNRVIAKFIIMIFPVFYVLAYSHQKFLSILWVKVFMVYLLVISILLILYQMYSCTWGHHEQPSFVYQQNNIQPFADQVITIRRQFQQNLSRTYPNTTNTRT